MPKAHVIPPPEARPIPGIPGYLILDGGTVYSCWHSTGMTSRWVIKTPWQHPHTGRLYVRIKIGDKNKLVFVHHLVLWAFVGPCPPGLEGCHNDGNHINNLAFNLRWDTRESNIADKFTHGTVVCGEGMNTAKLTEADIPRLFELAKEGVLQVELARRYGVKQSTISSILRREHWKHVAIDPALLDVPLGIQSGEKAPAAKIKAVDVIEIFKLFKGGMTQSGIARQFNITPSNVIAILTRKSWKSVSVPDEYLPAPR